VTFIVLALSMLFSSMAQASISTPTSLKCNNKQVTILGAGEFKIHTYHGVSNSHIIETKNELRVIDAQFTLSEAKKLRSYIKSLNKPLVEVMISHDHPDHWFGSKVFLDIAPISAISSVKKDLISGGMRYINNVKKNPKLKDNIPSEVIVPNKEIKVGVQKWDGLMVIVEEYKEHEADHSMLIKIPSMGIMIGQDLFYNNMFLVASDRQKSRNWRALLEEFSIDEAMYYKTLLVGHGKNGGPSILTQGIAYLDELENVLSKNLPKAEAKKILLEKFPQKGGKRFLDISLKNLYSNH